MPRLAEMASDPQKQERSRPKAGFSPSRRSTTSSVGKVPSPVWGPYPPTSDKDATSDVGLVDPSSHKKGRRSRGNRGSRSGESSDSSHSTRSTTSSGGRRKKKDGFSSKIQIPEFGGKKGHSGDVTDAFRQWARCITYYRDYYENSYLMPLVVSSLTGDASDVFDWILSLNHGEPQDLTTLLQHYCGSLTFREQRNMIENLRQKPNEAAINFLIRVGTSVSNLAKDWKDELTEGELQALQYQVSLNGVKEEIGHVLDSEMAKRDGHLTPQQMYEAVKRYETYVAQNKRLDGKGTSTSTGQQKTTSQASGYKPQFHKTTAFVATTGGPDDEACPLQDSSPYEDTDSKEVESSHKEDEGLYIPNYPEEAIPDDPVLQVRVAHALRVQEMNSRRCFTCNRPGHLTRDHQEWEEKNGIRPLQPKGPLLNKLAPEKAKQKPSQPGWLGPTTE